MESKKWMTSDNLAIDRVPLKPIQDNVYARPQLVVRKNDAVRPGADDHKKFVSRGVRT